MSQSLADEVDPIPRWTRIVRQRLRDYPPGRRGLRVRVTFGFVFLALVATLTGAHPTPLLGPLLFATMLLQELPGAFWAYALRRFVRVTVGSAGGRTEVVGEPVPARFRLAAALAGCATSLAIGGALLLLARTSPSGLLSEAGRLQLFWGGVQLLPLFPFKLGWLLAEHVRHWARVKHAVASLGVALAVLLKCASQLALPLVLVAFGVWLYACCHELLQSITKARDARLAAEQRLRKIRALTLADEPQKAMRLARHLLRHARSVELRSSAVRALAWAAIGASEVVSARDAIAELPESELDAHLLASYLATSNRPHEAIALLEDARNLGLRSSESLKLLADLYYRVGDRANLAALAASAKNLLSEDDLAQIERALASSRRSMPPSVMPCTKIAKATTA
jgi:hypothetical protein